MSLKADEENEAMVDESGLQEAKKNGWIVLENSELILSCGAVSDLKSLFRLGTNLFMQDTSIRKLTLRYCRNVSEVADFFNGTLVSSCTSLEAVVLDGTSLSKNCLVPIVNRIERKQLKELAIHRHWIGCDLGVFMAKALKPGLEVLQFEMTHLGDVVAKELLQNAKHLRKLDLSSNNISAVSSEEIKDLLTNGVLESFVLAHNLSLGVATSASKDIASGISASKTLRHLDLRGTNLEAGPIFEAVGKSQTIESLLMGRNMISDRSVEMICKMIRYCESLRRLDISCNQIGNIGFSQLCAALSHNSRLEYLDVHQNSIDLTATQSLKLMLEYNTGLEELVVTKPDTGNADIEIGAPAIEALFKALQTNRTLRILHVNQAKVGESSIKALSDALKVNPTLSELHMKDVYFPNWTEAIEGIKANSSIEEFVVETHMNREQKVAIECYTRINRYGRKLVRERGVPLGILPLAMTHKRMDHDVLLFLVRENPILMRALEERPGALTTTFADID